jgi:hypothetical protein
MAGIVNAKSDREVQYLQRTDSKDVTGNITTNLFLYFSVHSRPRGWRLVAALTTVAAGAVVLAGPAPRSPAPSPGRCPCGGWAKDSAASSPGWPAR